MLDTKLSDEEEGKIVRIIDSHADKVKNYHKLKTTKSGNKREIDFHIMVDPQMTVAESHKLVGYLDYNLRSSS